MADVKGSNEAVRRVGEIRGIEWGNHCKKSWEHIAKSWFKMICWMICLMIFGRIFWCWFNGTWDRNGVCSVVIWQCYQTRPCMLGNHLDMFHFHGYVKSPEAHWYWTVDLWRIYPELDGFRSQYLTSLGGPSCTSHWKQLGTVNELYGRGSNQKNTWYNNTCHIR